MKIDIKFRIYDDRNQECKEGDMILIQTKDMPDPMIGIINEILAHTFTITFNNTPLISQKQRIRTDQVIRCERYKYT